MSEIELIVFDLAGTTVVDGGQVPRAFIAALNEHDLEVTPEQLSKVRGASKRQALLNFIPEGPHRAHLAETIYASFRSHLTRLYKAEGVEPVPGAEQAFKSLRERGLRVALNTGFDRETTALLLDELGWNRTMVDAVVCGDDVPQGRPAPYLIFSAMEATGALSVHRIANVGDTVLDLEAGYNAGVRYNIGVLSGAHSRSSLELAPHTHLIPSVAELPDLQA